MQLDGWLCPKCGRVWGPLAMQCLVCNLQSRDSDRTLDPDETPKEPRNSIVQRAIVELSAPGSALRARLQAAAADLASAGYPPGEIAARIEHGESVDV